MSKNSNEKKSCTFLKVLAIILILVGIALFVVGIIQTIQFAIDSAKNYSVLPSDPDDFFDDDNPIFGGKSGTMNLAGYLGAIKYAAIGIVCIIVGMVFMLIYRRKNRSNVFSGYEMPQTAPMAPLAQEETAPVEEPIVPAKGKSKIFCAYCGCELDEGDKKCPNCGASKKFKK